MGGGWRVGGWEEGGRRRGGGRGGQAGGWREEGVESGGWEEEGGVESGGGDGGCFEGSGGCWRVVVVVAAAQAAARAGVAGDTCACGCMCVCALSGWKETGTHALRFLKPSPPLTPPPLPPPPRPHPPTHTHAQREDPEPTWLPPGYGVDTRVLKPDRRSLKRFRYDVKTLGKKPGDMVLWMRDKAAQLLGGKSHEVSVGAERAARAGGGRG